MGLFPIGFYLIDFVLVKLEKFEFTLKKLNLTSCKHLVFNSGVAKSTAHIYINLERNWFYF